MTLYYIQCGCCSGDFGKGWVAKRCHDPDPDRATSQRSRSTVGRACYVCAWDSLVAEADEI